MKQPMNTPKHNFKVGDVVIFTNEYGILDRKTYTIKETKSVSTYGQWAQQVKFMEYDVIWYYADLLRLEPKFKIGDKVCWLLPRDCPIQIYTITKIRTGIDEWEYDVTWPEKMTSLEYWEKESSYILFNEGENNMAAKKCNTCKCEKSTPTVDYLEIIRKKLEGEIQTIVDDGDEGNAQDIIDGCDDWTNPIIYLLNNLLEEFGYKVSADTKVNLILTKFDK